MKYQHYMGFSVVTDEAEYYGAKVIEQEKERLSSEDMDEICKNLREEIEETKGEKVTSIVIECIFLLESDPSCALENRIFLVSCYIATSEVCMNCSVNVGLSKGTLWDYEFLKRLIDEIKEYWAKRGLKIETIVFKNFYEMRS